jgi:3,4-dihydroxy-2-butanone 4-phosphate synthase
VDEVSSRRLLDQSMSLQLVLHQLFPSNLWSTGSWLTLSGYICVPMPPARLSELLLPPLVAISGTSEDPKGTAYHLTFDANSARHPVTTGISAHDRSYAIRLLADGAGPEEFTRPGHLVTLRYKPGGVVERRGHTEAAVGEFAAVSS